MARVIILAGAAGSGKGTAAKAIKEVHPRTQEWTFADPFKWFLARVFRFTKHQLYGPSAVRSAPDHRYPAWSWRSHPILETWVPERTRDWSAAAQAYARERLTFGADLTRWAHVTMPTALNALDEWWSWMWNLDKTLTPRHTLQTIGSEMGRELLSQNIWVSTLCSRLNDEPDNATVVVSDGRFNNEFQVARNYNGHLWHLERADAGLDGDAGLHASEQDMYGPKLRDWRTRHYVNNGTVDDLTKTIREWAATL